MRWLREVGVLGLLMALVFAAEPGAADPSVDPFDVCASMPPSPEADRFRCEYMAARRTGDFERAEAHLTAHLERPWAQLALANVWAAVGDPRAEAGYRDAAQALVGQPAGVVNAQLGLRSLLTDAQRIDEARAALEAARQAAGTDASLLARVDAEDARLRWRLGDIEGAARLAQRVPLDGADHQLKLITLHVLAGSLLELGQVDRAWVYSEALIAHAASAGDAYAEATARLNALEMLADHPELSSVDRETLARQAVVVAEAGGNPYSLTGAWCHLGEITADGELLQRCLDAGRELDDPVLVNQALRALSRRAPPADALLLLDQAQETAASVALRFDVAQTQHERARRLWELERFEDSDAMSEASVRTVAAIRDTYGSELSRAGFSTIWRTAWLSPAHRWIERHELERAWSWSERMRARELLAQRIGARPDAQAQAEVGTLQDRLWDDMAPAERQALLAELSAAEDRARVVLEVVDLATLQGVLGPREALVTYVVSEDPEVPSWAWVITPQEVRTVPLPDRSTWEGSIDTVLGLEEVPAAARDRLHDQLFAPIEAATDAARFVIVPDGALNRLPWGLLTDAPVSLAPSATVWHGLRSQDLVASVLSLAEPTGAALPSARAEGQAWVDALGGLALTGDDASLASLNRELGSHGLVHIASHATVDPDEGGHGLLLSEGPIPPEALAALPLEGRVIVLAACQGSDGPVFASEGTISLARAFLQGGARAVVASLVPLRDDEAGAMFGALAEQLAAGKRLDVAAADVRGASTRVSRASLAVWGDGGVVMDVPPRPSRWWAWLVGSGGLGLLAVFAWRTRQA